MSLEGGSFRASDRADIGIYWAAASARGTHPGLIIFPSIFGVTDELVEHAEQIAATGAVVVALDPFARSDDPGGLGEGDRERAFKRMGGIDFARVTRDFRELLAALKQDPACNGRVVGLGHPASSISAKRPALATPIAGFQGDRGPVHGHPAAIHSHSACLVARPKSPSFGPLSSAGN